MKKINLLRRIISDPDIMCGKPIIKGTRITVSLILNQLSQDYDINQILIDFPHVTKEDIFACLIYAKEIVDKPFIQ